MGRYRPPLPRSSPYITRQGYRALADELKALWKRRAGVTRALTAAAAEGDRSENAEYIYRKKELREIDRRIRYLQKRLPVLTVVSDPPSNPDRVFFGARVTLEDDEGRQVVYRIVGADEFDPAQGWISMDSPVARALMKKTLDDQVQVQTPRDVRVYYIVKIEYTIPDDIS
ncbi:MAG: transcription elongation factor GreB [Gammaproteobacteria bacterium]